MRSRELRIGNVIKRLPCPRSSKEEIITVDCISENGINEADCFNDGLCEFEYHEGIPLTDEWLVKFGFKYDVHNVMWALFIGDPKNENIFSIRPSKGGYFFGHDSEYGFFYSSKFPFQNVHQLQNLYFAITGEELFIK